MQPEILDLPDVELDALIAPKYILTLHNDDYNTFDWVIECLIKVCEHKFLQATQCAHIVHNNGKCDVKKSDFETVKLLFEKLQSASLTVSMESE